MQRNQRDRAGDQDNDDKAEAQLVEIQDTLQGFDEVMSC